MFTQMLPTLLVMLTGFAGDVVELGTLKSNAPDDWKEGKAAGTMQYKVFTLPKAEGDGEPTNLTIFQFGPSVGGLDANLERWKKQIEPAKGKNIDDVAKVENFEVSKVKVTYFDATGTYLVPNFSNPNAEKVRKENYRLINVYFPTDEKVYTIRLVGPAKSVAAVEKGFKDWLKNFK